MNERESALADGMLEEARTIAGISMRPFSLGSLQLAILLGLTLFTHDENRDGPAPELSEFEVNRQIVAFAWMQSRPIDEIADAIAADPSGALAKREAFKFGFTLDSNSFTLLLAEINRIGKNAAASHVTIEQKHKGGGDKSPSGKSETPDGSQA